METREIELIKKYNLPNPLLTKKSVSWLVYKDSDPTPDFTYIDLDVLDTSDDDPEILPDFYENGKLRKGFVHVFADFVRGLEAIIVVDDADYWEVRDLIVTHYMAYKEHDLLVKYNIPLPSVFNFSVEELLLINRDSMDLTIEVHDNQFLVKLSVDRVTYLVDLKLIDSGKGIHIVTSSCGNHTACCIVSRSKDFKKLGGIFSKYYGIALCECI